MKKPLLISALFLTALTAFILIILHMPVHTEDLPSLSPAETPAEAGAFPVFSLKEDLPGEYALTALFSDELRLTESELTVLCDRGVPLALTLRGDGTAALSVFDARIELEVNDASMFFCLGGQTFPFFYQDGMLTIWDSGSRVVFKKIS